MGPINPLRIVNAILINIWSKILAVRYHILIGIVVVIIAALIISFICGKYGNGRVCKKKNDNNNRSEE